MFVTKHLAAEVQKFWKGQLIGWNAAIFELAAAMPSKFRIQATRLVTAGKGRNDYLNLNMRDWFIACLCYFPATLPDPSFVTAECLKLGLPELGLHYTTLYGVMKCFGEGLFLLIGLNPTPAEILEAQALLDQAFLKMQAVNKKGMSFNWHTLFHFCERMLKRGNMRSFWLFFFERLNKMAKATLTNGRNGSKQVLNNFCKKHITAQQAHNVVATELPSLVSDCQTYFASNTNPETGKDITAAQQKSATKLTNTIVDRIGKRANKTACPSVEQALVLAFAGSDHPKLFSCDKSIDNGTDASLKTWPVEVSTTVMTYCSYLDSGSLHRGLFEYLLSLYPSQHIEIEDVTMYYIGEVNGVTFEVPHSSSSHTSHVHALRPDDPPPLPGGVDGPSPASLHVAKIVSILSVKAKFTSKESIAPAMGKCTCDSPWPLTEERPCKIINNRLSKCGSGLYGVMKILIVDWLRPFHKVYLHLDFKHESGKFMTTDIPFHEFDSSNFSAKVLKENREGKHFLDARRVIHGVVLKKIESSRNARGTITPSYSLVLQLPKFI